LHQFLFRGKSATAAGLGVLQKPSQAEIAVYGAAMIALLLTGVIRAWLHIAEN